MTVGGFLLPDSKNWGDTLLSFAKISSDKIKLM